MPRQMISKEIVIEMHGYYCQGYTQREIGEAFGNASPDKKPWSRQYISKLFRDHNLKTRARSRRKKIKPSIQPKG